MNAKIIRKLFSGRSVLAALFLIIFSTGALATHSATVTITPDAFTCDSPAEFTLVVENDIGSDDALEFFHIYNETTGTNPGEIPPNEGFDCDPAPEGWLLFKHFNRHPSFCEYITEDPSHNIQPGESETFSFRSNLTEQCNYNWEVRSYDVNLNWEFHYPPITVDCTPPETTKTLHEPLYMVGPVEYISTSSLVELTATDHIADDQGIVHDTGINVTYWLNDVVEEVDDCPMDDGCSEFMPCADPETYCNENYLGDLPVCEWNVYEGQFHKEEESCHVLRYWSVDGVGNEEGWNYNCFYVDDTPPVTTKTVNPDLDDDGYADGDFFDCEANENTDDPAYAYLCEGDNSELRGWLTSETPVLLECDDQDPHPSGVKEIRYRITLDGVAGDWEVVQGDETVIYFGEESKHELEYYCVDNVDNEEEHHIQVYRVDNTPPEFEKTIVGPQYGECPPAPGSDDECWVKADVTEIQLDFVDPDPTGYGCNSDGIECKWGYYLDGEFMGWNYPESTEFDIIFPEGTEHELHVVCHDKLGNVVEDIERFYVDDATPDTSKSFNGPFKAVTMPCFNDQEPDFEPGIEIQIPFCTVEWINGETELTLESTDYPEAPCASGVKTIYYRNTIVPDENCWNEGKEGYCMTTGYDGDWTEYTGTFTKDGESCHMLEYYAEDNVGHKEPIKTNCFFVDMTEPVLNKTIGEPKLECTLGDDVPTPERTGNDDVVLEEPTNGVCTGATAPGQCAHVSSDALPPYAEDTLLAHGVDQTVIDGNCGDILILSSGQPMDGDNSLSADVGGVGCGNNPDGYGTDDCVTLDYTTTGDSIVIAGSSEWPEYYSSSFTDWMRIGGMVSVSIRDWEPDVSPPHDNVVELGAYGPSTTGTVNLATIGQGQTVELRVADSGDAILDSYMLVVPLSCFGEENPGPSVLCGNEIVEPGEECDDGNTMDGDGCSANCLLEEEQPYDCWWVRDHVTPITLDCEDQGDHPVEQEWACFKVSFDDPQQPWLTEQYCEGNGVMQDDWCCVYVGDPVPPTVIEELGEGMVAPEPEMGGPFTFTFKEDSVHDLEVVCKDHLGNEGPMDLEYFKVDSVPPETTKEYLGPFYESEEVHWIDTASRVKLTAVDGGPICHVDGVKTYYDYGLVDDELCWGMDDEPAIQIQHIWKNYTEPFPIPEESCHVIWYYSVDALGNTEDVKHQYVFVDKTPPAIAKDYVGPYFEYEGVEWINSLTEIHMSAEDQDPHPSGLDTLEYRITLVDDENCWNNTLCQDETGDGEWTEIASGDYTNIGEESCHLIEIKATDNVDKYAIHKQCVFVDNSAPDPVKEVGEPKDEWHPGEPGEPANNFYPEASELCWNTDVPMNGDEAMECWEVTTMTHIDLNCEDPEPHPVDHETVCFKVGWDAEDITTQYCGMYGGDYNVTGDGFCCVDHTVEFFFDEETEHELEYYCIDALGNTNLHTDREFFKVEGTKFEIPLFKKWNLISVPFVLMNDDPEEVFEDVEEEVDAVWTYDGPTGWHVYTPDGDNSNDDIEDITPGWGYWVLVNTENCSEEPTTLTLGGSLFSPQTTPPSRQLTKGWNLVGKYGVFWQQYPMMDCFEEQCVMPWPGSIYGDSAYCSLETLVDTTMGYPKWQSLWGYINCCGGQGDSWHPMGVTDTMYDGKGYWVEIDEDDNYSPHSHGVWCDLLGKGGWAPPIKPPIGPK